MIWYEIYTENRKFRTVAKTKVGAWFLALMLGYRAYFDLNPQRVFVITWMTIK